MHPIAQTVPRPFLPKEPNFSIWDVHPEEIARQLTLIEWKMWKEIQPWECLGLAWTKKDKEVRAPNGKEKPSCLIVFSACVNRPFQLC